MMDGIFNPSRTLFGSGQDEHVQMSDINMSNDGYPPPQRQQLVASQPDSPFDLCQTNNGDDQLQDQMMVLPQPSNVTKWKSTVMICTYKKVKSGMKYTWLVLN